MSMRKPPRYFDTVKERTRRRWDQLENDPELVGPWKQLFGQVQSPRHVLSELLQNADDVGAKCVHAGIDNDRFFFEHDGDDFDEAQFASLCRFGFSNKRKMHTIGFRGVGFKSLFSLGGTVEVLTPTLAVRFHRQRFTEPVWLDDAESIDSTRISVLIQDASRRNELQKNLREWVDSPASLLFFNSIQELKIDNVTLRKEIVSGGPDAHWSRIRLSGQSDNDVILFRSAEESFPEDALEEIRQERDIGDLNFPPCRVELVIGLPGDQRLYVVLPTGVIVKLPFSCNAPFLQDPARSAIKSTSLSPTNRWLLRRLGQLAADAMKGWLSDQSLDLSERSRAYQMLPSRPEHVDSLAADVNVAICSSFEEGVSGSPLLLTQEGQLVHAADCVAPPKEAYAIWEGDQLLEMFGKGKKHLLCGHVTAKQRSGLSSWGWLEDKDKNDLLNCLSLSARVPRPRSYESILTLWHLVQDSVGFDYLGSKRRVMAIVPVQGMDFLLSAGKVVRLPAKKETISDEAWAFLADLVSVIDPGWLRYVENSDPKNECVQAALKLLEDLRLVRASDASSIAANACEALFARSDVSLADHVQITHLLAAFDARIPKGFRCVTRDGHQREIEDGVIANRDAAISNILPEDWVASHLLHDRYFTGFTACSRQQWEEWLEKKGGFWPFIPFTEKTERIWSKSLLLKILEARGVAQPSFFPYSGESFQLEDRDFDEAVINHIERVEQEKHGIWADAINIMIRGPKWYLTEHLWAGLSQISRTGNVQRVQSNPIPAAWIVRLRNLPCLPDSQGNFRAPAELYRRTPDTEPFLGVEPFVRSEYDTEATREFLQLLGVRDKPAGINTLVERLRALSRFPDPLPLLSEILKWYEALNRALSRITDNNAIEEIRRLFAEEPLILTKGYTWARSTEVFLCESHDYPDPPLVHPSVTSLEIWLKVGVAQQPTVEHVLYWLKGFPSCKPLDRDTAERVRAAMKRFPAQIWQNCRHWLSLNNSWEPVENLSYRITGRSLTHRLDLFPRIKERTADVRMLSVDILNEQPFESLPDLGEALEYRLTPIPDHMLGGATDKPWLACLARMLSRIKTEDVEESQRIRSEAGRLERSRWLTLNDHAAIQVTPYVEQTPAGHPLSPLVLWKETTIFVKDGGSARSFKEVVAELARPFANSEIGEAIKACYERDDAFIEEYISGNFELDAKVSLEGPHIPVKDETGKSRDGQPTQEGKDQTGDGGEEDISTREGKPVEPKDKGGKKGTEKRDTPQKPPLFDRYMAKSGYRWSAENQS